ncbi:MAG TPA: DUF72 domain-containing protein [Ignavibacteriaceae bacterium]
MIRFGTCSWKYDSWRGLVYSDKKSLNHLEEYSKKFNTVEVDQWFWSLFEPSKAVLPSKKVVEEYNNSTPDDFLFTVKAPNSLTLTHFYNKNKAEPLKPNPYFFSSDLFIEFFSTLKPIHKKIGCLIFQFEYLNKQKMSSLAEFQKKFEKFYAEINKKLPPVGIEIRNPNYLTESYFKFLKELKVFPVLLEGYFMPSVAETYKKYKYLIQDLAVIRLHGPDRQGIEKIANENWNQIYVNRDKELKLLIEMIKNLQKDEVDLFVNVNNHFEGSAPLTIGKIKAAL